MANKRYVCIQACQLGGKRYETGEYLADGIEPNSHFKDTKTGEMVKAKKAEPVKLEPDNEKKLKDVAEVKEELAKVKEDAAQSLDDFKKLVGEHLAKFDKRLEALEKAAEAEKNESNVGGDENQPDNTSDETAAKQPAAKKNA